MVNHSKGHDLFSPVSMKLLLKQDTPAGPVYIGQDEDQFHVIWFGRSLGFAETLEQALSLASGQSISKTENGTAGPVVSADPARWVMTKS